MACYSGNGMDYDPHKSSDQSAMECWRNLLCGVASKNTESDIRHALDRLLSMEGVVSPDSPMLVRKIEQDATWGTLLDIVVNKTALSLIELHHAYNMVDALLERGANPLAGLQYRDKKTSLGRLLDGAMEADHRQEDLTLLVSKLIRAGDAPSHYLNQFRDELGPMGQGHAGAVKSHKLLNRALTMCGQRSLSAFLDGPLRTSYEAGEISKQTPAVHALAPPRRM